MPVRIRLDLPGDQVDTQLLDLVVDATTEAASRVVDRASRADALRDAVWSGVMPDVTVRFHGAALPSWAAAHLETGTRTAVQTAAARLRSGKATTPAPVRMTRRLRQFASDEDLVAALDGYAGIPRLLVVSADSTGKAWMRVVDRGPGGDGMVIRRIPLRRFVLPADGQDAVSVPGYGGFGADSLHYVASAETVEIFQQRLAQIFLRIWRADGSRGSERELAGKAAKQAAKYKLTGYLYEFRVGDTPTAWFRGVTELTRDSLPLVVLSEEVAAEPRLRDDYGKNCPPLGYDQDAGANADPDRPFLHELELSDWDVDDYLRFSELIDTVVGELGVPRPRFVGSFVLATVAVIRRACETLGLLVGTDNRKAVLGRQVRALEAINKLMFAYTKAVLARDRARKLPCPLAGHAEEWAIYLNHAYFPARRELAASLFVAACQDALLAVLERSAADIAHRLASTDWLVATRTVLTGLLADLPELTEMRRKLREARDQDQMLALNIEVDETYRYGEVEVVRVPIFPGRQLPERGPFRSIYRIRDAAGTWHRLEEVEAAVRNLRFEATLTDPFLDKLADIPEVVRRLRAAQQLDGIGSSVGKNMTAAVDNEFFAVLREIQELNREHTQDVRTDRSIAFGLATFQSDSRKDIHEKLSGVHREADELLASLFSNEGKHIYSEALTALAHHEISKAKFYEFLNLVGMAMLAVFFPELAFVVGLVQAVEGIATAADHAELQRSMLGGEDVLSRAQVEAEMAAAWIQGFLAIAPELPAVVRNAVSGARALARGELTEVTAAAFRAKMREISTRLAEATAARLAANFLAQVTAGHVLNLALSEAIGEFARAVAAEYLPAGTVPREQLPDMVRKTITDVVRASGPAGETPS